MYGEGERIHGGRARKLYCTRECEKDLHKTKYEEIRLKQMDHEIWLNDKPVLGNWGVSISILLERGRNFEKGFVALLEPVFLLDMTPPPLDTVGTVGKFVVDDGEMSEQTCEGNVSLTIGMTNHVFVRRLEEYVVNVLEVPGEFGAEFLSSFRLEVCQQNEKTNQNGVIEEMLMREMDELDKEVIVVA